MIWKLSFVLLRQNSRPYNEDTPTFIHKIIYTLENTDMTNNKVFVFAAALSLSGSTQVYAENVVGGLLYYAPKLQNMDELKAPCEKVKASFYDVIAQVTEKYGDKVSIIHNQNQMVGKYITVTVTQSDGSTAESLYTETEDGCKAAKMLMGVSIGMNQRKEKENKEKAMEAEQLNLFTNFRTKTELDLVSKVLNYSDFGQENGSQNEFWYPIDKENCVYAKASFGGMAGFSLDTYLKFSGFRPENAKLSLNSFDPRNVKIEEVYDKINNKKLWQVNLDARAALHCEGPPLTMACDQDRLIRGWSRIYSEFCSGIKREF